MTCRVDQRRGSAASSVTVIIETVTTTTTRLDDLASTDEAPVTFVSPCPVTSRRGSTAGAVAQPPHQAPPVPSSSAHAPSYTFPPPPPYGDPAPTPRAAVHPLTFFAFSSLTPVPSSSSSPVRPSQPDAHIISMPAAPPPPPAYAATPRTEAERRFWHGFLCPALWVLGARRIWRSERLSTAATVAAAFGTSGKDEAGEGAGEGEGARGWTALPPDVRESLELWREEELVWARRPQPVERPREKKSRV
ncbi:uncharacterized protein RHOBADRAFT_41557 [Rhodotorula graminis WP1]|uniref:Uncharacterized protein n=1 Tax=Rhodotorula graminis (strain WP1) TaxID=578459 RepID=A0A194SAS8_RHOGW|nr:uncharacterized protein RHOBADRAFT_41557 [Rhodotorula graminis WP1]KPV77565.1 hypothetical protein RHOBADRAFT_41557 [Rhodotorula graminis WP1]